MSQAPGCSADMHVGRWCRWRSCPGTCRSTPRTTTASRACRPPSSAWRRTLSAATTSTCWCRRVRPRLSVTDGTVPRSALLHSCQSLTRDCRAQASSARGCRVARMRRARVTSSRAWSPSRACCSTRPTTSCSPISTRRARASSRSGAPPAWPCYARCRHA